jgi:hypothetical protein
MEKHPRLRYPYYSSQPHIAIPTVTTVDGNTEYKSNCTLMDDGGYYVRGVHLEYIESRQRWVKIKQPIKPREKVLDHETGQMVEYNGGLYKGIVSIDADFKPTYGYFTPNPHKNCTVILQNDGTQTCIDYELLPPTRFFEQYSIGYYVEVTNPTATVINGLRKKCNTINHSRNTYNVEDNPQQFSTSIELYNKTVLPIDKDIRQAARFIKGITFGAEIECINGTLPAHIMAKYGVIICKDGSTRDGDLYPPEFVTVPLQGAKGLQTLRNLSAEISKRCDIDIRCSLHLHIGGMEITRIFMVSLYRLCYKIQNDVLKMFPYYKTEPKGIKEKNYCKKLLNILRPYGNGDFNSYINESFADIYTMLSGGIKMDATHNIKSKVNPWGSNKWDIKTRYSWVNFINPIFGKHNTIEFRVHTPTTNPDKMINWLLMCAAIVKYAELNTEKCISSSRIKFTEVLDHYVKTSPSEYTKALSKGLQAYYKDRCDYFKADFDRGDYMSTKELIDDANFKFNIL